MINENVAIFFEFLPPHPAQGAKMKRNKATYLYKKYYKLIFSINIIFKLI